MRHRSKARLGAALLAASLALTACGSRSDEGSGSGGGDASGKTATIGFIAPISGDLSALGLGMRNSVDLAIKQANESNAIPGWTLKFAPEDDQATADVGKNAATKLAGNREVIAVVGTLNSSVAQQVQPILNSANILMVSPANTGVALTKGEDEANPARPYKSYFRTSTNDAVQGPFAAQYVYNDLKLTKVATVHDKKTYGQGLVAAFTAEFKKLGGTIVAAETINPDEKRFTTVITKIAPKKPELVYYGGEYPQAAPFSSQMRAAGLKVPLMGGDALYSAVYFELSGAEKGEGDLATSVGAPVEALPSAAQFVKDYDAAGYADAYEAYGAYTYDAATAIIEVLKTCLAGAESVEAARPDCVEAMNSVSFDGTTGRVAFDEFGDTTTKVLTVYEAANGEWKALKTGEFK